MIEHERAGMTELTSRPADLASSLGWSRVRSRPRLAACLTAGLLGPQHNVAPRTRMFVAERED